MTTARRKISIPLLVVVAVLALVVGTVGTTTVANSAGAMTKSKVKKIAAKVVKKAAPTLSVAHATTATTATNATNLNGQPASAYQTSGTFFRLAPKAAAGFQTWTFAVPAGTYQVNYNVVAHFAAAGNAPLCYLRSFSAAATNEGLDYGTPQPGGTYGTASSNATLVVAPGQTPVLNCSGNANFTVDFDASKSSVSFLKMDVSPTVPSGRGTADRGNAGSVAAN
jgi:hypothetical protein